MAHVSALEENEIKIAQLRAFGQITPVFSCILCLVLVANVYVHYGLHQWDVPVYLQFLIVHAQLFIAVVAALHGVAWYWLNKRPDLTEKHSKLLIGFELVIWLGCAPIISFTNVLFMMDSDGFARFFTIMAEVTLGMLAYFNLCYMRKTSLFVISVIYVPMIGIHFDLLNHDDILMGLMIAVVGISSILYSRTYFNDFLFLINSKINIIKLLEKNAKLASLDMLTEVPNRRFYFDELAKSFARSVALDRKIAVGVIDLDGFKPVNDTYGHRVGDRVLAIVAKRLAKAHPKVETFCRIGGDEFAFIVPNMESVEELAQIGECLVSVLLQPMEINDLAVGVGCSIGFACSDQYQHETSEEAKPEILYEYADFALYHAKRTGKSRSVVFSEEHRNILTERGRLEQALRIADLENEIYPVFQPMVDVASGQTLTFEALARWQSPTLGNVPPSQFIPVIEQAGLMARITPMLLQKCIQFMQLWPKEIGLSFNLSSQDLCSPETIERVLKIVAESDVGPARIAFEVTESTVIQEFDLALHHIQRIREAGIKIALDDFGTGYSSLSYVNKLPLDKLKIDKSFVEDIETSSASQNIVRTVISLCRDLKMQCVVEGAETQAQIAMLQSLGCETVQGYFYSKPMAANAIAPFLLHSFKRDEPEMPLRANMS
jgi:diguanylate cyclase (GGDEF)-like protein